MNHIFITRMAVVLGGKAKIRRTKSKTYETVEDRISDIVEYWLDTASKFYTQQTADHLFKVYVVYSPCYEKVIRSYTFPEWCILTTDKTIDKIKNPNYFTAYDKQPVSVTRVDADDWYSNDYFAYLADIENEDYITTHLHKDIRLYNRATKVVSVPQHFSSPGFASLTFPEFDVKRIPLRTSLWPHGNIKRRQHTTPDEIYGMQSVGCNVVNRWRHSTKPETNSEALTRFYIPS